jgi:hypothetical protein
MSATQHRANEVVQGSIYAICSSQQPNSSPAHSSLLLLLLLGSLSPPPPCAVSGEGP